MKESIRLPDGRILACAEYGDPRGRPVFLFHGAPGSRLFRPPFDDRTAALGVRLITVDRPGFGRSDFQPGRRISDWPADILYLADELGLGRFAVCAHSAGGPYALACAALIPGRLTAAAVVSGIGFATSPADLEGIRRRNRMGFVSARYLPEPLWNLGIWTIYRRAWNHPAEYVGPDKNLPDDPDNQMLAVPGVLENCLASVSDAMRQGTRGMARDSFLVTRPWRLPLEKIPMPVHFWHGDLDFEAPIAMAQAAARTVPKARMRIFPNEGHLLIVRHWEELLQLLAGDSLPTEAH